MLINAALLASDVSLTDDLIITRVLLGKRDYYEILIRRYNNLLYKTARGILSKEEDVEDVMQEAYIRGFEKLHQFRREAKFSTWLGRILINCALQHLQKMKGNPHVSIDMLGKSEMEMLAEDDELVPDPQVGENIKVALEAAINHLPEKYRIVFMLREIQQTSVAETAGMLAISEENVKIRLHRAKNMLKTMLQSEVAALDLFPFHATRCSRVAAFVMDRINSRMIYPFGNIGRHPQH